jgi:hypothetical protein
MATNHEPASRPRRPFTGFDRERQVFGERRRELLASSEGKYVVVVGDRMIGAFETEDEAERSGYDTFGLGPLYIKRVLAAEPIAELRPGVNPCRS